MAVSATDGVNVETKHAYIWLDTGQWLPGSSITLGIQSIVFMTGPLGGYFDDDGAAIKINMKFDPVDVEVYAAKAGEGNNANADDTDMYVARVGINATKEIRVTLEGMLVNEQSLAGANLGDTLLDWRDGWRQARHDSARRSDGLRAAAVRAGGDGWGPAAVLGERVRRLRDGAGPGGSRQRVRGLAGTPRVTDRSGRRAAAARRREHERGLQRSGRPAP